MSYLDNTITDRKSPKTSSCERTVMIRKCVKSLYYSTIAPFYNIRAKERAKYATLLHCRTGQKYGLKRSDKMAAQNEPNFALFTSWNGGIINPLFDGLTYNTSGHFAHCSYFSSPLRDSEKYYANSQNIRAYYMLNHRIRCMHVFCRVALAITGDICVKSD